MAASCVFCKIVRGILPSHKLIETERTLAFLDIGPLSEGHCLVIPKAHSQFFHQVSDTDLAELLPMAKKVALALNVPNYNLLQNNGRPAHQFVDHVSSHFHIIPKQADGSGLGIQWPTKTMSKEDLEKTAASIRKALAELKEEST
ncbi:HIT-like protein [Gonapodya prolifera JEL478]|uniref:HIT-like protein n=1 Tax=Gonapodya prolifera (strain JEL478) TaxID=1344416 RepID=A0A139AB20_GONPJ|nr:HIT-like protein [Gonapodya prolifera JEL478]|eukprot:KXS14022.1 HIT-like protein [Gonapodya prolifera JEL478]